MYNKARQESRSLIPRETVPSVNLCLRSPARLAFSRGPPQRFLAASEGPAGFSRYYHDPVWLLRRAAPGSRPGARLPELSSPYAESHDFIRHAGTSSSARRDWSDANRPYVYPTAAGRSSGTRSASSANPRVLVLPLLRHVRDLHCVGQPRLLWGARSAGHGRICEVCRCELLVEPGCSLGQPPSPPHVPAPALLQQGHGGAERAIHDWLEQRMLGSTDRRLVREAPPRQRPRFRRRAAAR
jgi:hypothetical protein